jgi:hypothetical protein
MTNTEAKPQVMVVIHARINHNMLKHSLFCIPEGEFFSILVFYLKKNQNRLFTPLTFKGLIYIHFIGMEPFAWGCWISLTPEIAVPKVVELPFPRLRSQ